LRERAERPATAVTETAPAERWYGYQTLLADAASLTLLVAGIAVNDGGDVFA